MKASRFTDAQKAFAVKQAEYGIPVTEIRRTAGIATMPSRCPGYQGLFGFWSVVGRVAKARGALSPILSSL